MSLQEAAAPATTATKITLGKKADTIIVSAAAAKKVAQLIEAEGQPDLALRVAVRPGGCSGFSYEMFFDSDVASDDIVKTFEGIKVVTDAASAQWLIGATLEYKDALQGGGFTIDNPNATRSCGCGNSFS
jgi:iron-sulfur cluster assembly accessory protein